MYSSVMTARWLWIWGIFVVLCAAGAARGQGAGALELTSALGRKLYALPDDAAVSDAKRALAAEPKNAALALALSKAQAGRRQYKEAVATDTAALASIPAADPANADLLLERGHRELGLRDFAAARRDLDAAVKASPKMADAYYHLGLAHFFVGEFDEAAVGFARARGLREKSDLENITDDTAWLYASLRLAGQDSEAKEELAAVPPEYTSAGHAGIYLQLVRFYQGKMGPEAAQAPKPKGPEDSEGELAYNTTSFGLGNWYLYQGHDEGKAKAIFQSVVQGEAWNSWGFIGSEVMLGKMK